MEKYLEDCVDSLYRQNLDKNEFEVIIVNDESKDKTLEIAKSYEIKYNNIVVVDKKNAGVGAARNSGLDVAKGVYIIFIDPDDYLADNVVSEVLTSIRKHDLDILTFISKCVKNNSVKKSNNLGLNSTEIKIKDGISYIASRKYKNEIWWYITKKSFITENGFRFIEGKWMEDAILTAEMFCKAQRMAHIELDCHRYRILPTSAMRNKSPEHYKKVIYDNANAAKVFDKLLKSLPTDHKDYIACKKRLRTRQQSFVFFLLVRLMKSDIPIKKIPEMLNEFEKINAYPLKQFIGQDYNGFSYSFMVFIFNNRSLIDPFVKCFRFFYNLVK